MTSASPLGTLGFVDFFLLLGVNRAKGIVKVGYNYHFWDQYNFFVITIEDQNISFYLFALSMIFITMYIISENWL